MNPYSLAAKRLGIPESEFEDALTKEINELLREIEEVRLEAQRHAKGNSTCAIHSLDSEKEGKLHDSPQQTKEEGLKDGRPCLSDKGAQRASPPKRCTKNDKNDNFHPLEKSGRHFKVATDPRAK